MEPQQVTQVAEEALGVGEWVGWLLLTGAIAAFVAWGLTELINLKWLKPYKRKLVRQLKAAALAEGRPESEIDDLELGWWWTGLVASVAALIGGVAGAVVCPWTPIGSVWIGLLVGLGAGASPAWIVKKLKRRAGEDEA